MRYRLLVVACGLLLSAIVLTAQVQPPRPVARGGADAVRGIRRRHVQVPAGAAVMAVRAGRLFDSKTGTMLTKQVVIISGERITDVGPRRK